MDRYARKRAWNRKTLSRSRRAACRSDRWQGICGSPPPAEYETSRIEGEEAPAAGSAQRPHHVEAPKSGKTFKGVIQTTNAFDLSRVPRGYEPPACGSSTPARPALQTVTGIYRTSKLRRVIFSTGATAQPAVGLPPATERSILPRLSRSAA